ncbi:choline dehydrogenase-like flavoprotein [Methylorubrum rhodinum]|uniref:Choline dehydrogenase-like flavoprotein n=1 Tax=Methylorubrum rhodinum TaxID=29428 RepID=A0A840ZTS6_9HYPH|nr:GMC family oxidoreductase [Methylorubrum rhodinum]MBB5760251.1 choline dehydrogenase-like flavoprotein [Methylorubrum rhodinum]
MILSADTIDDGTELPCDLCIVGAGAAGITLALQFLRSGLRVVLLEGGGLKPDAAAQALYRGEVADPDLHPPTDRYRQRTMGGTTTVWSGRCIPFDPIDFAARPWLGQDGWPIAYDEVARWYPAANALCEAGDCTFSAAAALPDGMRPTIRSFAPEGFDTDRIERFSPPTDFGARYRARLAASADVRVLIGANALELVTDPDGSTVRRVAVATLAGRCFAVAAGHVVVATGGIETARLLLASRRHRADGVGNAHGLVGRFYMCHIAGTIGTVKLHVPRDYVWSGYERAEDGAYCRRRWTLSEAAQRHHGVANGLLRLHFPTIPDPRHGSGPLSALYLAKPFIGYEHAKRLHNRGGGAGTWLRHLGNVAREPAATAGFFLHAVRHRALAARKYPSVIVRPPGNLFSLDYHGEQVPNFNSRVSLGRETDALGLPRVHLDWRHSPVDIRTAEVALSLLDGALRRWGRGRLDYDPAGVAHHMLRDGAYGGHHIGTARMGATPAAGVVDTECRVHGVHNLFLAGAAVFPTSSQANPTLTVVALALRLADRLKRSLAPARVA